MSRAFPNKSRLGKRLLILSVSLCASLVAAEILYRVLEPAPYSQPEIRTGAGVHVPLSEIVNFLRVSGETNDGNPRPGGRLKPGLIFKHCYDRPTLPYFDPEGCVTIEINDLGFRDEPFALQKKPGELRILAVGDSFTFGSGVRTEDTWPQVLEGLLGAGREGPVEVINAGFATASHHPVGYVDWLRSDGIAFAPEIVVLGFCLNDMGNVPMLAYPIIEPEPWLGGISKLLYSVQQGIEQRKVMALQLDATQIVTLQPEPWEQNKEAIRAIHQVLEEHGIRLIVAVLPMLSLLGDNYPYLGLHELVADFCTAEGIESVDLLSAVRGRDELELWVHPTDQHPNHIGHRLLAEGIHDYLRVHPAKGR